MGQDARAGGAPSQEHRVVSVRAGEHRLRRVRCEDSRPEERAGRGALRLQGGGVQMGNGMYLFGYFDHFHIDHITSHHITDDVCCAVMLGKNVSFINADPDDDSEQNRFMEAFHGATEAVRRCETGMHVWKLVETPAWKKLVRNCDVIDGTLARYISEVEVEENANSEEEAPLVQLLLSHKKISPEEVLTVFLDMVLIGVNAVRASFQTRSFESETCSSSSGIAQSHLSSVPPRKIPQVPTSTAQGSEGSTGQVHASRRRTLLLLARMHQGESSVRLFFDSLKNKSKKCLY